MVINFSDILGRLKKSSLAKDSFWAVFGNGMGNALILLAGIIIARLLGKDLYGEYGMVKTTMFYIASFSTFGLSVTSTKFIAEYIQKDNSKLKSIAFSCIKITLLVSLTMCLLLVFFAKPISVFVNAPQLITPFRFLGIIIICRAISYVTAGLLGGFKSYKELGKNNIISGLTMLLLSVPLTYYLGLKGSLLSLMLSQLILSTLNLYKLKNNFSCLIEQTKENFDKPLLSFSFPVAMQELAYCILSFGAPMLITKYASIGEVGIYTAAAQWNVVIVFIPTLLSNVVLSYLSTTAATNTQSHKTMVRRMLLINFVCAVIPFIIVYLSSPLIVSFYGKTFAGMRGVLKILTLATIFSCLNSVFTNNLLSLNKNWILFIFRTFRDFSKLILLYIVLKQTNGFHAAINYSIICVSIDILFLLTLYLHYIYINRHTSSNSPA